MNTNQPPIRLRPSLQHYAWGDRNLIRELLNLPTKDEPIAEAWFGTHPMAPAQVIEGQREVPLSNLIATKPEAILGAKTQAQYGDLPYLLKVLAAEQPLSIQVHPNSQQAIEGFEREERAGIPRNAKHRCYRDKNHKPEVIAAITPFYALAGFRDRDSILTSIERNPELAPLLPIDVQNPHAIRTALEYFFGLSERLVQHHLGMLISRLDQKHQQQTFDPLDREHWTLRAHQKLGSSTTKFDRGIVFIFLLELIHLRPGQAIYLPAGLPHAYLQGAGVELMASSDNVIRAGLTSKHVDVPELLRIVRFDAAAPPILDPSPLNQPTRATYSIPANELRLDILSINTNLVHQDRSFGPETLLVTETGANGWVTVETSLQKLKLQRGQACLLPHGQHYTLSTNESAKIIVAGLPQLHKPSQLFRKKQTPPIIIANGSLYQEHPHNTDLDIYVNTKGFLNYLISIGDAVPGTNIALASQAQAPNYYISNRILRAISLAITEAGMNPVICGEHLGFHSLKQVKHVGWPSILVASSDVSSKRWQLTLTKAKANIQESEHTPLCSAISRMRCLEYQKPKLNSLFDDEGWFKTNQVQTAEGVLQLLETVPQPRPITSASLSSPHSLLEHTTR